MLSDRNKRQFDLIQVATRAIVGLHRNQTWCSTAKRFSLPAAPRLVNGATACMRTETFLCAFANPYIPTLEVLGDDQGTGDPREDRGDGGLGRGEKGGCLQDARRGVRPAGRQPTRRLLPAQACAGQRRHPSRRKRGGARRTRRRETTSETAVESAIATLRRAIDSIDAEIEVAKERAKEAQAEYEAMQASADERKASITEKITLLEQPA